MEIHKPKAAHSLREFLIEIGTIVCGIVIALSGEEMLTTLHHRDEGESLRNVLNSELAWNLANLKDLADARACADQRMEELERWRLSLLTRHSLKLVQPILLPKFVIFRTSAWRSSQSGSVEHLPLLSRIAYAQFYDSVEHVEKSRDEMVRSWSEISDLSDADSLTPQESRQIKHDIRFIRYELDRDSRNYRIWLENYSPPLGVKLVDAPQQKLKKQFITPVAEFCRSFIDQ